MSSMRNENQGNCAAITTGSETVTNGTSFEESMFGAANPISFSITEWESNGI